MTSKLPEFWSVTSLIRLALGTGYNLVEWNARMPSERAYDKIKILQQFVEDGDRDGAVEWLMNARHRRSGEAKVRGTDIHKAAENLALGRPVEIADEYMPYVEQFARWVNHNRPRFLMAEAPVYNTTWRYAGTLDGVMELPAAPGRHLVYDIKTTEHGPDALTPKGTPRMRPPYPDVALQLCAYSRAEEVGLVADKRETWKGRYYVYDPAAKREPMPPVDQEVALCIGVSPFDCYAVPVRIDDTVWRTWLACFVTADFTDAKGRDLFGPPILGPGPTKLEEQLAETLETLT